MGSHYTTQGSQPAIMTREHLEACRHLFSEVPQWVEDECDKRSVESENFKSREVVGSKKAVNTKKHRIACSVSAEGFDKTESHIIDITAPATEAAKQWDGWGTALKPACEFFTLCRKPLSEKTIAANVLKWGTGGINVDGCRVGTDDKLSFGSRELGDGVKYGKCKPTTEGEQNAQGRFPANLIHDGSPEVLELFPETKSGALKPYKENHENASSYSMARDKTFTQSANSGSAARFFYCAKASKKDRDEGNNHPTVKPTALMAYLCRLITPPGGVVLDPYMGSGSTGKAAVREGFGFVGCELDPDYFKIATARVENEQHQPDEQTKQHQPDETPALGTVELSFNF
jgi:site-specific DNA-methyltransferase (adenine-specific)